MNFTFVILLFDYRYIVDAVKNMGKFEIFEDKKNKLRFRLRAENGEIIAQSESYENTSGLMDGINAIKEEASDAPIENLTKRDIAELKDPCCGCTGCSNK
jgi:hypothetical protein